MNEVNSHTESESERYIKQLIRINQVGIWLIVGWIYSQTSYYPFLYRSVYGFIGIVIFLNVLAFLHSAYGFNPADWVHKRL